MCDAVKLLSEQGLKAYHNLLILFVKVKFDVKTKLNLFDTMVAPILLQKSEVWGAYNYKVVDNLHLRFCRYILGEKKATPNCAVYGELGRYPLSIICKERALKYWCKLIQNDNCYTYILYNKFCITRNGPSWAGKINLIIDTLGLSNIRLYPDAQEHDFPIF